MWLKDHQCEKVVKDAWKEGCLSAQDHVLNNCLQVCRSRLDTCNKLYFGHVGRQIKELQSRLECLEKQPSSHGTIQALRSTRIDLNGWLDKEDSMWR